MRYLRIHDIKWSTPIAGPGPQGLRTELFLRGCRRARLGAPCEGCFNPAIWSDQVDTKYTVDQAVRQIVRFAPSRHITIGGGEPTDQLYSLIDLCHGLKRNGFHIILYTWRSMIDLATYHYPEMQHLLGGIDVLVDGEFRQNEKIYDPKARDGVCSWIGSGNQTVWDIAGWQQSSASQIIGYLAKDIANLSLQNDKLALVLRLGSQPKQIIMEEEDADIYASS